MTKTQLIEALMAFINQRSGIEFRNYWSGDHWNSKTDAREAFMSDYKPILRHGKHARRMLRAVELRDSITAENIIEATRAYAGRLQFVEKNGKVWVDYTTGQYFPTEYRNAACAVLAQCLWDYWHGCADCAKDGKETYQPGIVDVGAYIRKQARNEFGPAIARTWFN